MQVIKQEKNYPWTWVLKTVCKHCIFSSWVIRENKTVSDQMKSVAHFFLYLSTWVCAFIYLCYVYKKLVYLSVFLMDSISKALYIKMPWDIQSKAKPPKNSQHFWGSRTSPLDEVMTSKHQLSLCKPESEVCSGSQYLLGIIMWVARHFFLLFSSFYFFF